MDKRREWLLGSLTVFLTLVICLLLAEIVLRFLPVPTGMGSVAVNARNPVFHFTPNRDFVYSRDWDMVLVNRGHVNNAGFVNDQDYRRADAPPMLAVIGDSMIEAAMVPFPDTMHARLAEALAGKWRIYSFACAGAPLSQYLIWARHAVRTYGAEALIITVMSNDYDESHSSYKFGPGFWLYVPDADGKLELRLFEYDPGLIRNLILTSALARYVVFNLQLGLRWIEFKSLLFGPPAMAEPAPKSPTARPAEPRLRDSLAAVDAFLRDLPAYSGLSPDRVMFVVEGFRYPDLAAAGAGGYFDRVRTALMQKAQSLGYQAVDLDPFFFDRYRRTGERLEFARDGHWNRVGHGAAFDAVMASRFMARLSGTHQGMRAPTRAAAAASGRVE